MGRRPFQVIGMGLEGACQTLGSLYLILRAGGELKACRL